MDPICARPGCGRMKGLHGGDSGTYWENEVCLCNGFVPPAPAPERPAHADNCGMDTDHRGLCMPSKTTGHAMPPGCADCGAPEGLNVIMHKLDCPQAAPERPAGEAHPFVLSPLPGRDGCSATVHQRCGLEAAHVVHAPVTSAAPIPGKAVGALTAPTDILFCVHGVHGMASCGKCDTGKAEPGGETASERRARNFLADVSETEAAQADSIEHLSAEVDRLRASLAAMTAENRELVVNLLAAHGSLEAARARTESAVRELAAMTRERDGLRDELQTARVERATERSLREGAERDRDTWKNANDRHCAALTARAEKAEAALTASVKREDVVRWLEERKAKCKEAAAAARARGDVSWARTMDSEGDSARDIARLISDGSWLRDLTTMDAGTAEAKSVDWRTVKHPLKENDEDDLCALCRGAGDDPIHDAARPADKEDGNG